MPDAAATTRDQRPSPEALLEAARQEGRGRLKVFLGMAPGVGKTFAMLDEARRLQRGGVDVVAAVVETHGRQETEALLQGLELLTRREVAYNGRVLDEMDLDALLRRRPKLALVDELAHTNAPGSRHPKRFQDVEELLAAGIDVLTTVNIQHLESLNDVVARITRVRVRETVPDRVLDEAEIELVDITPAELTQRLQEGKVYMPAQAERALEHFFQPGNLTALRELALRRTAERVDAQMRSYMRAHAIEGPWAAGDRILVCVNELEGAAALVRTAKRQADRLHASWIAVHVRTARYQRLSEPERDRIADTLRLAERLGAQTLTMPGDSIAEAVLAYARESNVTQIIIGKSRRTGWFELLHGSVVRELVARAEGIAVHVLPGAGETVPAKRVRTEPQKPELGLRPYLLACLMVAAALGVAYPVDQAINLENESLLFILPIILSAVHDGLWPSLLAAGLSTLAYNFFFLPPLYTFSISDPSNVVAFAVFGIVALASSSLAGRARSRMIEARTQARTTGELYAFSRKLTGLVDFEELLWATVHQIATMLRAEAVILLPAEAGDGLEVRAAWPPEDQLDDADMAAARWSFAHNQPAGRDAETLPGGKRLFLPMRTGRGKVGLLGITRSVPGVLLTSDQRRLLDALLDQVAIAIERTQLARHVDETRLLAETERLRAALLTSVSHDLKTPLSSILGTITSLREYWSLYDTVTREEMLSTAQEEAERLARFLENLLDVTRLESGVVGPKREPVDLADVVGSALRRAGRLLARHKVTTDLPPDLPLLALDFMLLEQVLVNLLENAARHTPPGTAVEVVGRQEAAAVVIEVRDGGPGISPAEAELVFDKFYRVQGGDTKDGSGLGLAVCRGFVEAMEGSIAALPRPGGAGTVFRIAFPARLATRAVAEPADAG